MSTDPAVIEVGVALLVCGGGTDARVLVTRRRDGSLYGGYWEFPGGKVEPHETPRACVVREMWEELAVEVEPFEADAALEHVYEHGRVRLWPWWCRLVSGQPRAVEVATFTWVDAVGLASLKMLPANGPLVAAVARRLAP